MANEQTAMGGNPNSQHQLWSKWEFGIEANPRKLPKKIDVVENARRYFAIGFKSSAGKLTVQLLRTPLDAKLLRRATYYYIAILIEGPPVHDPTYREHVKHDFIKRFMQPGFGTGARLVMFRPKVMAGDKEDGTPPDQMLELPSIRLADLLTQG